MTEYIAADNETFPIGAAAVLPKVVCTSFKDADSGFVLGNAPGDGLYEMIRGLLESDVHLIFHVASYDLGTWCATWPDLFPLVFQALADDRCHDTLIREKLLNVATTGDVDYVNLPGGQRAKTKYKLYELAQWHLGKDRQAEKEDSDSWRTHFELLDGHAASSYPSEAYQYALEDASDTYDIFISQADRALENRRCDPFVTETFHVAVSFALQLETAWGIKINQEEKARIEAWMAEELHPSKMQKLVESGILEPAEPPRPYAKGAVDRATGKPKMTKGKTETVKQKRLQEHVAGVWKALDRSPKLTPTDGICCDADVMTEIADADDTGILQEFQHRANLQKIVTTELPRMSGEYVHPRFDVLKETGRTSSFADSLYPSANIQNVDPRVRECYEARDGWLILSTDYSAIELVSLAQKCFTLFGKSKLRDLILAGHDPHAYLGSQLALHLDPWFRDSVSAAGDIDPDTVFQAFLLCKESEEVELRDFFAKYRKFAKPTGLGYPGGLGPDTFVTYAKGSFGVEVDKETAIQLREIWFGTFPEMRLYFEWINSSCNDPDNPEKYAYVSPMGMYRAGCSFCAASNGAALQTPAAEGAKLGIFRLVRACYDPSMGSILYGCHPLAFIHDENLVEIPDDAFAHERVKAVEEIMQSSMECVLQDMTVTTESALMLRWNKYAQPVFDDNGRLTVWKKAI